MNQRFDTNSNVSASKGNINSGPENKSTLEMLPIESLIQRYSQGASGNIDAQIKVKKRDIDDVDKSLAEVRSRLDELDQRVESSENKNIETIAVITALFSFIAISFQLFSKIENIQTGLDFLLILSILLIILLSFVFIHTKANKFVKWIFFWAFIFILSLVGIHHLVTNIDSIKTDITKKLLPDCSSENVKSNPQTCINYSK